jgi:hypothetical protein
MGAETLEGILAEAMAEAEAKGYRVDGWMLDSSAYGFAAWLYYDDGEMDRPLFDGDVDIMDGLIDAARAVLEQTKAAPAVQPVLRLVPEG